MEESRSSGATELPARRLPMLRRTLLITLPRRLGIRLPIGEYWLCPLMRRHASENENASSRALCSGSTGRRYLGCGIFSPGL